jgi:nitrate reductase gamma subunit
VLLLRRGTNARLQANTTVGDFVVLGLLLFQVLVGLGVAAGYRWGSVWSTGTIAPYLWSLVVLHPDPTLVEELPPLVKLHLAGAWILFLVVPFSRLVHLFSFPFSYVVRPPQQVVWAGIRRLAATRSEQVVAERRQLLLKGGAGILGAAFLLSLGVFDKMFQFFRGPRMSPAEEIALLQKRLKRLESTARERNLQLERMQSEYIFVARLSELSETEGKYFIDYQMRPALAFRGPEGLPLLISAKCTHLGCTVASQLDEQGRVLCPCHISYFDIATGMPNTGSPAKTPLPHLGWVLMDDLHEIVAESPPGGPIQGEFESARLEVLGVYIARRYEEAT